MEALPTFCQYSVIPWSNEGLLTESNFLGQTNGIVQHGIPHFDRKVLCRGDLDNFLVSPLNGAVALVEMDHVTVVITKELDFDVLGLLKETFDEDGAVTKRALGLR